MTPGFTTRNFLNSILTAGWFSPLVNLLAVIVAVASLIYFGSIYERQTRLLEQQTNIAESQTNIYRQQTEIFKKQTLIAQEQANIAAAQTVLSESQLRVSEYSVKTATRPKLEFSVRGLSAERGALKRAFLQVSNLGPYPTRITAIRAIKFEHYSEGWSENVSGQWHPQYLLREGAKKEISLAMLDLLSQQPTRQDSKLDRETYVVLEVTFIRDADGRPFVFYQPFMLVPSSFLVWPLFQGTNSSAGPLNMGGYCVAESQAAHLIHAYLARNPLPQSAELYSTDVVDHSPECEDQLVPTRK